MERTAFTLTDPMNGNLAFRIHWFSDSSGFDYLQRNNYYTAILITSGEGVLKSGFSSFPFSGAGVCFFSPYQPYLFEDKEEMQGVAIHFHPDFFCIYRHHNEVASNGIIYNNAYDSPYFSIDDADVATLLEQAGQLKQEVQKDEIARQELLVLHLKVFLINAIRMKSRRLEVDNDTGFTGKNSSLLEKLRQSIEENFRTRHAAGDYAELLNTTGKTLGRLTKNHLNKTVSELIGDRIIIEAKRDLYLTSKAVKEIAYSLGFKDEFYFSRFFKKRTDISPQIYRETVGSGRQALLKD